MALSNKIPADKLCRTKNAVDIIKDEGEQGGNQFKEWWDIFELMSYCRKAELPELHTWSVISNRFKLIDLSNQTTAEAQKALPFLEALKGIVNISNNEGMPNSIINPYTLLIEIEKAAKTAIDNYNK